jgi:putative DNA primase/helicase
LSATANNGQTLQAARAYLNAGLSVVPIRPDGSKRPVGEWEIYQRRVATEAELQKWWGNGSGYGVGVVAGRVSQNLEHLDFDKDAPTIFPAWCELVEAEHPGLIDRCSIRQTPKDGRHVSYRCQEVEIPGNTKLAQEPNPNFDPSRPESKENPRRFTLVETRGEGGQVLAPGTPAHCHTTGKEYLHLRGPKLSQVQNVTAAERETMIRAAMSFGKMPLPQPKREPKPRGPGLSPGDDFNARGPDFLEFMSGWQEVHRRGDVRYLRRPGKDEPGWSATIGYCKNDKGHDLLAVFSSNAAPFEGPTGKSACSCYSKFAVYALLRHNGDFSAAAKDLAAQGYGERKNGGPVRGGGGGHPAPPPDPAEEIHPTDKGNAKRVIKRHGADLRYCFPWGKWLVWDDRRWLEDERGEVVRRVKEAQASLYRWAADKIKELGQAEGDEGKAKKIKQLMAVIAHVLKWENAKVTANSIDLARSEEGIPIMPAEMDRDGWLLNCANGTLDLRSGKIRDADRQDHITKLCDVAYDPHAKAPAFEKFLSGIFAGNAKLIAYMQRLLGYCLTGDVREQILPIFWGAGANGKSTLVNAISDVLGEHYAIKANRDLFMAKKGDSHPAQMARLFGKRLVICVETHEGARLDEGLVKELTGGDTIAARRMREDWWQFAPTHKPVLVTNHRPEVRGTDHAIWRRLRLIPFTVTFADADQDKQLGEKLKAEAPGILAWLVRGCLEWQQQGLGTPDIVMAATSEYRGEQDKLGAFLHDRCATGTDYRVKVSDLFAAYQLWCKKNGEPEGNGTAFGLAMGERGFRKDDGKRWYLGVMLTASVDEEGQW